MGLNVTREDSIDRDHDGAPEGDPKLLRSEPRACVRNENRADERAEDSGESTP
jgi:hypothetical protein